MRVAALELPHRFGEPARVLDEADRLLAERDLDLCLLPELALTGYVSARGDFDLSAFAEPLGGPTTRALGGLARRRRVALGGPLVERDGEHLYNALLLFDREGELAAHYRKRHPWYPERWATPGDRGTPVVSLGGVAITAFVCFDLHFVAEDAPDALGRADLCLFPSAWVDDGCGPPEAELVALARRFDVAIVNANWGPGVPRVPGQGGSRIVGAGGEILARAAGGGEAEAVSAAWEGPLAAASRDEG